MILSARIATLGVTAYSDVPTASSMRTSARHIVGKVITPLGPNANLLVSSTFVYMIAPVSCGEAGSVVPLGPARSEAKDTTR